MNDEPEAFAAASPKGALRGKSRHVATLGSSCANCRTILQGPYCHACGQLAESFERSIWSLVREAVENLFDVDGRVVQTLPRLVFRPASLTSGYLAGRRASQAPPLRLFLVVVVLVFFVGSLKYSGGHSVTLYQADAHERVASSLSFEGGGRLKSFAAWLQPRFNYAVQHQKEFAAALENWLHRIAIMLLPVATGLLGLLFVFQRRFFLFDHAIFSMHSLSFLGLLFTAATLLGMAQPLRGIAGLLVFAAPVHLFVHMRGVYGTSVLGALIRMLLLFVLSVLALVLILLAIVGLELAREGAVHA